MDEEQDKSQDSSGRRSAVAVSKNKNILVGVGLVVVTLVVLYYFFTSGKKDAEESDVLKVEKVLEKTPVLDDLNISVPDLSTTRGQDDGDEVLQLSSLPDVPELGDVQISEVELQSLEFSKPPVPVLTPPVAVQSDVEIIPPTSLVPPVGAGSPVVIAPPGGNAPRSGGGGGQRRSSSVESRSNPMIALGGGIGGSLKQGQGEDLVGAPSSAEAGDPVVTEDSPISRHSGQIQTSYVGDLRYLIAQGKMINAVLETAINTDLKGMLRAVVSQDVYSEDGHTLLIQRGSRLIGEYSTNISFIQSRVEIAWTRLILVNGLSIALNSAATDPLGRAGVSGIIDNKFGNILLNSLLVTTIDVGSGLLLNRLFGDTSVQTSVDSSGSVTTVGDVAASLAAEGIQDLTDTLEDIVSNYEDSKPTILVHQGSKLKVFVAQDIVFPKKVYKRYRRG